MTNEQLVIFIQQDSTELLPILWERVKRLCFMLCGRYYSKYRERFAACGVELCDLRQECYAAFLAAVRSYKADSGVLTKRREQAPALPHVCQNRDKTANSRPCQQL